MRIIHLFFLLFYLTFSASAAVAWTEADFESIASGLACPARIALKQDKASLSVALEIAPNPGSTAPPAVVLGLAATGKQILTTKDVTPGSTPGWSRFSFRVTNSQLANSKAEWAQFRLAAVATFPGIIAEQPIYRVRYRHHDGRAMHNELSHEALDWDAFDLNAYRQRVSDRSARVALVFDQPLNGKGTIVIDDAQGRRVRNLVSGRPYQKGRQEVVWDLLDDDGLVVPPGEYTWRSLHHAGIVPEYLFSFCNDGNPPWRTGSGDDMWGPDHSCFTSVAASNDQVFFLSPCAEAGYNGAATDLQGVKHLTWCPPAPVSKFLLASDGKIVFAAADDGKRQLLVRYEKDKGWNSFGNGQKEIVWGEAAMNGFGPLNGSTFEGANWEKFNLAGLAVAGQRLAVASRAEKGLILFDAVSGDKLTMIPLPDIGAVGSLPDGSLLVVSAGAILRLKPDSITPSPFVAAGKIKPGAMAAGKDGHLYVIDEATSQIAILNSDNGREVGRLGKPGGPYAGAYDAERMVRPLALALAPNGWLWVTENRFNPKRVLAWDLKTAKVVKEKFGSTSYGAPGGGMDPTDSTRCIGQGAIWKIDIGKKTAKPTSILFSDSEIMPNGIHWRFHRRDGRTFLLAYGSVSSIVELNPDGSGRLLAQYGSAQSYSLGLGQHLAPVFIEEFYRQRDFDSPEKRKALHKGQYPHNGELFVWSDVNGDAEMQANELEFGDRLGTGWGVDNDSLDIVFPLFKDLGGKPGNWRLDLPLVGWHSSGAPKWRSLAESLKFEKTTLPGHWGNEAALVDKKGILYLNAPEHLMAYGPDGALCWTYPNRWAGVHGSHKAPLPSPGELQGSLFFLGNAPLDDGKTDVFVINGNHGRFFTLTSDGYYLDEFFKDVRMGSTVDAYMIGGECFGGSFGRSSDKQYYLLSGHTDYRLFTLKGFDSIVRGSGGKVKVTPLQIEAADRRTQAMIAVNAVPATVEIAQLTTAPTLDGTGTGWPKAIAAWKKSGKFPVEVQAGWDADHLYLRWSVEDASPWSNHGKDKNMLFKTGDSVDIQIGTDPSALSNRTTAAPGDLRLLIAPFEGKPTAVLYRHRVSGTQHPVPFASPWRIENVDVVTQIDAQLNVSIEGNRRYFVEAAIPLKQLGLKPELNRDYRVDFGAIFGDPDGQMNQLRSYWSNQATGLVNDVPGEIMLFPNTWGTIRFLEGK